jgi:hypothetical protein
MLSSFIHFPANSIISFFVANWYSIVYTHHIFLILWSVVGHLDYFQMNSAVINMAVQVVLWYPCLYSSGIYIQEQYCWIIW